MRETIFCLSCQSIVQNVECRNPRLPCVKCGHNKWQVVTQADHDIPVFTGETRRRTVCGGKPSTDKTRIWTGGKTIKEKLESDETCVRTGQLVKKTRIIDHAIGKYEELIRDQLTGEIVHRCKEPLSQHVDHGSAKRRK